MLSALWEAIRRFFARLFGREVVRELGTFTSEGAPLGQTHEVVRVSGGTLRPKGRRLLLRDKRLLPKPRPAGRRPRILPTDEARRRFAGTLRTRSRHLGDLLADPAQLDRHGLPRWTTEAELAEALDLSVKRLRHLSIHREAERVVHWRTFVIPKRNGGERRIMAPKRTLKALLRRLDRLLVKKLPVHDAAHGFRVGRSVKSGAAPHVGKAVVIHLDLRDFFHQVTWRRVRGYLLGMGYPYPVAATLAVLVTACPRQPVDLGDRVVHVPVGERVTVQGAPTSPGLCNALASRLDARLSGLARKLGFAYTRYADDLSFSGNDTGKIKTILASARRICAEEGFPVNETKTRVMRKGQRQTVTGVTVNEVLGLSRQERRKLRAGLHQGKDMRGQLAWVAMLNPEQAAKLRKKGGGS